MSVINHKGFQETIKIVDESGKITKEVVIYKRESTDTAMRTLLGNIIHGNPVLGELNAKFVEPLAIIMECYARDMLIQSKEENQ